MHDRARSRLLATKTQRPKLPTRLIHRERLLALMEGARERTLTVLKAAAGFGKTSLALAWADALAGQGERVAWVSLDSDDDEPEQFLRYVAQALRSACPEIDEQVFSLIEEITLVRPLDVVTLLINAVADLDEQVFLFLDDYHALRHADVAAGMAYLLRHAPAQLHVVLTTRTEPDLPLVGLRARGELLEIDGAILRFDLQETKRFLEQEAFGCVGSADVAVLHEKTEGWPVMLRIVAATPAQPGQGLAGYAGQVSARHRPIRSHLVDMLRGLPTDVVSFLLRTSILESLSADLCRAVADMPQADTIFESLVARQLLLAPLDAEGFWYRCHPLLRSFLQHRLEAEFPESLGELHRRAYAWYAGEHRWTDAIRHAIAVGDAAEAVVWIEKCAMALLKRGELLALLTWERIVPPELMRGQVKARLAIAWGMALAMRFDEASALAAQIETELGEKNPVMREAIGCDCQTIRAVALALSDRVEGGLALAEDSLRRRASGRWTINVAANVALIGWWKRGEIERCYSVPWIASATDDGGSNVVATVFRECLQGLVEYEQLNSADAWRHFNEALRVATEYAGPNSAAAAQPAALVAQYLYDQGRLDEAEAMLADRLPLINAVGMIECVLRAYTVLIRIATYRGQPDRREELLERAHHLATSRYWLRLDTMVLRERVRAALRDGRIARAEAYLARLHGEVDRAADGDQILQDAVRNDLDDATALISIARGDSRTAVQTLQGIEGRARSRRNRRLELECSAIMVAALAGEAPNPACTDVLHRALRLAASCAQDQVLRDAFATAPRSLVADLRAIDAGSAGSQVAALAQSLGQALRPRAGIGAAAPRGTESTALLSPRETCILKLLAEGKSNKDIARELGITPETTKTHLKRMFGKMNVTNRSQAVSRFLREPADSTQ